MFKILRCNRFVTSFETQRKDLPKMRRAQNTYFVNLRSPNHLPRACLLPPYYHCRILGFGDGNEPEFWFPSYKLG